MTPRRARRLTRRAARPLLCAVLALAALVSPWESGLLPGPLEDLEGQPLAEAQTPPHQTVIDGDPKDCPATPALWSTPTLWRPQPGDHDFLEASECVLELPACPESPLVSGQYMRLSVPPSGLAVEFPDLDMLYTDAIGYPQISGMDRYPEFCEERIPSSDALHSQCTAITGYAVLEYDDQDFDGIAGCRILYPITCAAGLHRSGSVTCRAVQRRTWTCRTGYIPRNDFNKCYQAPTYSGLTHPACEDGAPEFLVMDCEEYVAQDFIDNSANIDCDADYPTDTPATHTDGTQAVSGAPTVELLVNYKSGPSEDYWCAFEIRYLTADCHRTDITPAECSTTSMALCLKRASATGGCNVIADTIRCRALEAAFAQQPRVTTIEEVRAQGCAPCLILPFRDIPSQCQLTPPRPTTLSRFTDEKRILSVMDDFAMDIGDCLYVNTPEDLANSAACRGLAVCADPPRGRIDWTSNHFSQLAVINTPILVQFLDIPLNNRNAPLLYHSQGRPVPIGRGRDQAQHYTDASGLASRFRTFSEVDQSTQHGGVDLMIRAECITNADPYFDVVIEELWPDNDEAIIRQLFGDDAIRWWGNLLPEEQERRTQSRGLSLLSTPPTTTQLETRSAQLTTQIHCDLAGGRACRWTPTRPGFYRLRGVGAWQSNMSGRREWSTNLLPNYLDGLDSHLRSPTTTSEDGSCEMRQDWHDSNRNTRRMRDKDCIRQDLRRTGIMFPSDVGLLDDLSGVDFSAVTPHPPDDAVLFNEDYAATAACRTWDFRVSCTGGDRRGLRHGGMGNYTETEPIGIQVHEIRVSTVMPNN